jgi:hypothetical protein
MIRHSFGIIACLFQDLASSTPMPADPVRQSGHAMPTADRL